MQSYFIYIQSAEFDFTGELWWNGQWEEKKQNSFYPQSNLNTYSVIQEIKNTVFRRQ